MTQLIENTSFRTKRIILADGELVTLPWPGDFQAGTVLVNAGSSTVAGIIHARSGGSPLLVAMATPLTNLTISNTDITAAPPASGTGKLTIGRSSAGLQLHAGGAFTASVTFLG